MKIIYGFLFLYFSFACSNVFAQQSHHPHPQHEHLHHDINQLDNEIELLLDTAAKHMIQFIFTQKEVDYAVAMQKVTKAQELNDILIKKAGQEHGVAQKIENTILEDRKLEFASYQDASLKSSVLSETENDRKTKVHFRGKSYKVSENSKKLLDVFESYLPRN